MKKPVILNKGDDPNCVHYEHIITELGTCLKCGQVRDYSACRSDQDWPVTSTAYKEAAAMRKGVLV